MIAEEAIGARVQSTPSGQAPPVARSPETGLHGHDDLSKSDGLDYKDLLQVLAIVLPAAIVFVSSYGAQKRSAFAQRLGIGDSLLTGDPQEDIRKGIEAVVTNPLAWGVTAALLALLLLHWIVVAVADRNLSSGHVGRVTTSAWLTGVTGLLAVALGVCAFVTANINESRRAAALEQAAQTLSEIPESRSLPSFPHPWISLVIGFTFVATAFRLGAKRNAVNQAGKPGAFLRYRLGLAFIATAVLLLVAYPDASKAAVIAGASEADAFLANRINTTQPVVVCSVKDLGIADGADVKAVVAAPASAYAFCYSGLRFFRYDRGRYVLMPNNFRPEDSRILVLADSPEIKVEFVTDPKPFPTPSLSVSPSPNDHS